MTDDELDRLDALTQAASPGPWVSIDDGFVGGLFVNVRDAEPGDTNAFEGKTFDYMVAGGEPFEGRMPADDPDTQFIAASRTAVPDLIAEVRRLRGLLEAKP